MLLLLLACSEAAKPADPAPEPVDADADGITAELDCDDEDAAVGPGAVETCDGRDEDCDGAVDEADPDLQGATTGFVDGDGDGVGAAASTRCDASGLVATDGDCDDTDASVFPGAGERCDGRDEDCDGLLDDADPDWDASTGGVSYADADADGYGDPALPATRCAPAAGEVLDATDCDDGDAAVNPGMSEVCNNGLDDDCDGSAGTCGWFGAGTTAQADARWLGDFGEVSGYTLELPGDLGEGPSGDLVVGCPETSSGAQGRVYVAFDPAPGDYVLAQHAGLVLTGDQRDDWFGQSTAAGDLDGDGGIDLLVGALQDDRAARDGGAVYVFPGPLAPGARTASDASYLFTLDVADGWAGYDVAMVGDTDGDGVAELMVGAAGLDGAAGAAFLVEPGAPGSASLADAVELQGTTTQEMAGSRLMPEADLDGDGLDDLGVGAFYYLGGTGRFYAFFGPRLSDASLGDADVILEADTLSNFTLSIAAGDLDGDGATDLAFGAPMHSGGGPHGGAVHLVLGPFARGTSVVTGLGGPNWLGDSAYLGAGGTVGLGDIDGDGQIDLAVGASGYDTYAGAAFLLTDPLTGGVLSDATAWWRADWTGSILGTGLAVGPANLDALADLAVGGPYASENGPTSGATALFFGLGG